MRKYIVHTLTLLSYSASIYYLFIDFRIRWGVMGMVLFFLLYHLSILDTPHFHHRYAWKIFFVIVLLGSVVTIILGYNWTTSVSLALFHLCIWFVGKSIYQSLTKHISFLVRDFNLSGLGIWTLCITFVPLMLGIGMLHEIPINCDSIRFEQLTTYIQKHYTFPSGTQNIAVADRVEKIADTLNAGESQGMAYLLSTFNIFKNNTINQIMSDRANIQGQVCHSIVSEAYKRLQQPGFQLSAIFLLFIVIYPVMGIIMFGVSIVGTILLGFLLWINVYKKSLEPVQAEKII